MQAQQTTGWERPSSTIQIKPTINHQSRCPDCHTVMTPGEILWQGIHVCIETHCSKCGIELVEDLPVGQGFHTAYQADANRNLLFGSNEPARRWFGEPLLQSLLDPQNDEIKLQIEKLRRVERVIILNCLDFLYGHSLLKLLNAEAHMRRDSEFGLVVIVPRFLRWLVPVGVAEIWTVDLPLAKSRNFYPGLHEHIAEECLRFSEIYLSLAYSHPCEFDITVFSGVERHDFESDRFRITFIWRDDRPWWSGDLLRRAARRIKPLRVLLLWQNFRVRRLFVRLRWHYPEATFTVAGLGTSTSFPSWVDDQRVDRFNDNIERETCRLYAESRLVIGVHGSNLLLPTAHAGMLIDLMPNDRWRHIAQDVLYQTYPDDGRETEDARMISWRHRYLPLDVSTGSLFVVVKCMLDGYAMAREYFTAPK